ncbi:hypothetical protein J3R83DRAFT_9953 [Lanmaoa asiatica]|nr:hypothetical protein J3R83DRAFT_9953 [Lanmaoa asiatica]
MAIKFFEVAASVVHALMDLGEYVEGVNDIERTMIEVRGVIGEIPILAAEIRETEGNSLVEGGEEDGDGQSGGTRPEVLADGTNVTETAYTTSAPANVSTSKSKPPLRGMLIGNLRCQLAIDFVPSVDDSLRALSLRLP